MLVNRSVAWSQYIPKWSTNFGMKKLFIYTYYNFIIELLNLWILTSVVMIPFMNLILYVLKTKNMKSSSIFLTRFDWPHIKVYLLIKLLKQLNFYQKTIWGLRETKVWFESTIMCRKCIKIRDVHRRQYQLNICHHFKF